MAAYAPRAFCVLNFLVSLKVPKREIFNRSDFPDFYTIKSLCEGDLGVKKTIFV
jgi:hypothetical protein